MPYRTLTLEEVADYLHLAKVDVERLMREADLPHETRGGRLVFVRGAIDDWASKRILGLPIKRLDAYNQRSLRATQAAIPGANLIAELLRPEYIDLELTSKTPASTLRDMVKLADRTGRVLDARELLSSVQEREKLHPTALPGGLALLHARHHAPYRFEGSFVVLGRTIQAIPFGAPDGRATRLFFLICCQDDRIHLPTMARLCLLAMKTNVIDELLQADTPANAYAALIEAEKSVLPAPEKETKK